MIQKAINIPFNKVVTLEMCLELHTTPEFMDAWRCYICGQDQGGNRTRNIVSTSDTLVINLKRFKSLYD